MKVEFWFDPACPFCWMTSRWITALAPERDLQIEWRPISLLFKNNTPPDSPWYEGAKRTRDLLRVVESVRAAGHGDRVAELYTRFGTKIHHEGQLHFEVAPVLADLGLDASHADALDDEQFDAAIRSSMEDALALVGNDVGTPIIAIHGEAGRAGLFGPVITEMPKGAAAVRLWDGVVAMAETNGFFELKRTRTGTPDMSTIGA
jgi:2-hydroxychromene-2-carboxylate isomerase